MKALDLQFYANQKWNSLFFTGILFGLSFLRSSSLRNETMNGVIMHNPKTA